MVGTFCRALVTALLGIGISTTGVRAQAAASTHRHETTAPKSGARSAHEYEAGADPSAAVRDAMAGAMHANPHMRMSPMRAATHADSVRAQQILEKTRAGIAKYKDVRVAERDGYRMFAPGVKDQPIYHFTNLRLGVRERFKFDPAQPSSLLYKRNPDGSLRLVGAMFTAPKDATPEELDQRVPLGIAQWHLHTNMCVPRLTQTKRWREVSNGKPVFGPMSPVATRQACDAVDGRFLPVVFNWMVHANVFDANVWGDQH